MAFDLGCGRGEWLELLSEQGVRVQGVDLDDGMLAACQESGLNANKGDAIAFLRAQPDEAADVISAFHVVEHIGFENIRILVAEALRVLAPGGVLLLETPNPENLLVGGAGFYMDPTHERPIPPGLLSFVVENAGFGRLKVVRLQEDPALLNDETSLSLWDVFRGVSPDYSVVAQKGGDENALKLTEAAFARDYGLTLQDLAVRYERKLQSRMAMMPHAVTRANHAEFEVKRLSDQLDAVYASNSWRITGPVRALASTVRGLRGKSIRTIAKAVLKRSARHVGSRPPLRRLALRVLNRFPGLKVRMRSLLAPAAQQGSEIFFENLPVSQLSPRVREIYAEMKRIFNP
ncbi:class I SAM-dependent methyltransferase [Pigmentiphaga sp.]|uniref:class I SAM-dependent methyltransferase n=1 Tax=Pigmentiphaga sp. TaxID=1977564 RepID=UPI0025FCB938|nr:class I SAM-dependent methyltransferase [Pigmentiphaga sp.]